MGKSEVSSSCKNLFNLIIPSSTFNKAGSSEHEDRHNGAEEGMEGRKHGNCGGGELGN